MSLQRCALNAFKCVVKEIREADESFNRNSALFKYLLNQVRDNHSQRVYSKAPEETIHVAELYTTYLYSTRKLATLQLRYQGGERSVEESAKLVGLLLPEQK
ncbi:hypothetical protein DICVIV_10246 [Dictyocaulus viviparus]|uniref:Protein FMC1 homolog n=1 Tax=Dictyocaulus viviparus TaxID=29172 RepID=A0A0D8XIX7_DICVI|nr:hypothetical protein DICVIV_10246 [Dictyocaulus viviparus]